MKNPEKFFSKKKTLPLVQKNSNKKTLEIFVETDLQLVQKNSHLNQEINLALAQEYSFKDPRKYFCKNNLTEIYHWSRNIRIKNPREHFYKKRIYHELVQQKFVSKIERGGSIVRGGTWWYVQLKFNSWINKDYSSAEVNSTWSLRQLLSSTILTVQQIQQSLLFLAVWYNRVPNCGAVLRYNMVHCCIQHQGLEPEVTWASLQQLSPTYKKVRRHNRV